MIPHPFCARFVAAVTVAVLSTAWAPGRAVAQDGTGATQDAEEAVPQRDSEGDDPDVAARRALEAAPKRRKIGRMRGVRFVSRVRFEAAPDDPHELVLSVGFPARSRVTLKSAGGRFQRYQLGDTWFGRDVVDGAPPASQHSFLLTAAGLDETQLDIALRRALFLWPDGGEFSGAGTTWTSSVDDVGVLLATVDLKSGRPTSIRAFGRDGRVAAELKDVTWTVAGARAWPKTLVFAAGGQTLWSEVVERIEDEWLFADTWFLPSDRIAGLVGHPIDAALRMRVIDTTWTRRSALPNGTTRELALDIALEHWAAMSDRLGEQELSIGPTVSIELDEHRAPVAIEVEVPSTDRADAALKRVSEWSLRGRSMAWVYFCETLAGARDANFAAVADAVATGGTATGRVMLRFDVVVGVQRGARTVEAADVRIVQALRVKDAGNAPGGDER